MFLEKNKEVFDKEMWIILEALDIIRKIVNFKNTTITIFCNLQKVLKAIAFSFTC